MQPVIPIEEEDEQALTMIQRDIGMALRLSMAAITSEPLPEQMTFLLRRLALDELEETQSALSYWGA